MVKMIIIVLFLLSSPLPSPTAEAFELQGLPEAYYVEQWCTKQGGVMEYVLPDRTRCDCMTSQYAIEFDVGEKWYEAVGQSMYYGFQTNHKPGIVLILTRIHVHPRTTLSGSPAYGPNRAPPGRRKSSLHWLAEITRYSMTCDHVGRGMAPVMKRSTA